MKIHSASNIEELDQFTRIHHRGMGKLILKKGEKCTIKVTAPADVVDHITYEVLGGKLEIRMKDAFEVGLKSLFKLKRPEINIEVTFVDLTEIVQRGTGSIENTEVVELHSCRILNKGVCDIHLHIHAQDLQTELDGIGNIYLVGEAENHDIKISGAGILDAVDLETNHTHIVNSGIGSSKIWVKENLFAQLNGLGKIGYKGNPRVKSKLNGVGSITSL